MKRTCFYHAGCPDGFGAAWAVRRAWGDSASYTARSHDDIAPLEALDGQTVAYVDIAPGNEELRALADVAAQVIVVDHHVSSLERYRSDLELADHVARLGHEVHFDLEHSGAVLAWHTFMPDDPVPELLLYVEDQDLWSWKLPLSQQVNAAIGSYPMRFDVWSELAERPPDELAREGEPILRANRAEVERTLLHAAPLRVAGRLVEGVNATQNRSALGHELAKRARFDAPWGAVYRVSGDRVFVTLYSIGELDVSRIARDLGGGGHRNAAGFHVSLARWIEEFV